MWLLPQEGILMARDNQLTCSCGSTFFYTQRAEQFAAGGYGTAEFRSISSGPKTILVCLCGQPAMPKPSYYTKGTTASLAEDEFRKSIEVAQKRREANSIQNIANIAAAPSEVQECRDQISELRKAILAFTIPAVPQPQEPEPHVKASKKKAEKLETAAK